MPAPVSGQIKLSELRAELNTSSTAAISLSGGLTQNMINGTVPHSVSEWYSSYAGIGYAGEWGGTTITTGDISSSGAQLYSEVRIAINANGLFTVTDEDNGNDTQRSQAEWNDRGWRVDDGAAYEAKWSKISGDDLTYASMASQNTWYDLTNAYLWLKALDNTTLSNTIDVTIRQTNAAWSEVTQRFTMSAQWTGTQPVTITWPTAALTITTIGTGVDAPTCGIKILNTGGVEKTSSTGTYVDGGDWLSNDISGNGSDYELKWTSIDTNPSVIFGTENTWIDIGTTLECRYPAASLDRQFLMLVTIRKDGDASTEVQRTVTLIQSYEDL